MPPKGSILDAEKKDLKKDFSTTFPYLYVKTTYLNFSQRLSAFIGARVMANLAILVSKWGLKAKVLGQWLLIGLTKDSILRMCYGYSEY